MKKKEKRKIFKQLRIVSSNYKITYHDEIRDKNDGLLDGHIMESAKEIKVCSKWDYQHILQVIFHESLHGIVWEMALAKEDSEERNIQLTTGLTCFMRDNVDFIVEYIKVLNRKYK